MILRGIVFSVLPKIETRIKLLNFLSLLIVLFFNCIKNKIKQLLMHFSSVIILYQSNQILVLSVEVSEQSGYACLVTLECNIASKQVNLPALILVFYLPIYWLISFYHITFSLLFSLSIVCKNLFILCVIYIFVTSVHAPYLSLKAVEFNLSLIYYKPEKLSVYVYCEVNEGCIQLLER